MRRAFVTAGTVLIWSLSTVPAAVGQSGFEVLESIPYATHTGVELLLDAYLPPGEGPFPAVIVIPGGRWQRIERQKHADVPTYFAEHGVAAFAIDYRSALEFPYPAAVEDVTSAVVWVRQHAADYRVNPAQLGAIGVSAGGHLAALVAAMGSGPTDRGSRLNMVLSFSGPMDLTGLVDAPDVELRDAVRTFLDCSDASSCSEVAREASPITYVDPTDPPMILVNSQDEIVPTDQPTAMWTALRGAGIDSIVNLIQGGHGSGFGGGTKVLDRVIPFVQAWLTQTEAPALPGDDGFFDGQAEGGEEGRGDGEGEAGGKSQEPRPSGSPAPGEGDGRAAGSEIGSFDVLTAATAMAALLAVVILLFVVFRLRRRLAALSEDAQAPGATVEQT